LHAHRSVRVGRGNAARRHLLLRRTHDTRTVTAAANLAESQQHDQRGHCERAPAPTIGDRQNADSQQSQGCAHRKPISRSASGQETGIHARNAGLRRVTRECGVQRELRHGAGHYAQRRMKVKIVRLPKVPVMAVCGDASFTEPLTVLTNFIVGSAALVLQLTDDGCGLIGGEFAASVTNW
jgi:hypothetical protein